MRTRTTFLAVLPLVAAVALAACGRKDETATSSTPAPTTTPAPATTPPAPVPVPAPAPVGVSVTSLDLGNAVGADLRVTTPSMAFKPADTIYAAVQTAGAPANTTLSARWTFQDGQIVSEETKTIASDGSDTTTFSIAKPDGWPVGKYKVEISANGRPAASREFTVQ